jgi:hypothetical protein
MLFFIVLSVTLFSAASRQLRMLRIRRRLHGRLLPDGLFLIPALFLAIESRLPRRLKNSGLAAIGIQVEWISSSDLLIAEPKHGCASGRKPPSRPVPRIFYPARSRWLPPL